MMVMRDERNRRWWLNERPFALRGRNVGLRTSSDLIDWSDPAECVLFNTPDMGYGGRYEWHGGITPFNYGNMNLGLLEKWCNAGMGDTCELVCQREGGPWQRAAPGTAFLDIGPEGTFDRTLVYPTHNPPWRVGDRLHIYYTGAGPKADGRAGGADMDMAIGVATIGLDRFAGLAHTRGEPGRLLTKPFRVERDRLEVNAELHFGRHDVRVAVKDAEGEDIPGYALDACRVDDHKSEHRVSFRVHGTPEEVVFEMSDNGIGMDRETREKAFSLFFTSKGVKGTGLGLFIADKIARAHFGKIELESELGEGTRIAVRIPRRHTVEADDDSGAQMPDTGA